MGVGGAIDKEGTRFWMGEPQKETGKQQQLSTINLPKHSAESGLGLAMQDAPMHLEYYITPPPPPLILEKSVRSMESCFLLDPSRSVWSTLIGSRGLTSHQATVFHINVQLRPFKWWCQGLDLHPSASHTELWPLPPRLKLDVLLKLPSFKLLSWMRLFSALMGRSCPTSRQATPFHIQVNSSFMAIEQGIRRNVVVWKPRHTKRILLGADPV